MRVVGVGCTAAAALIAACFSTPPRPGQRSDGGPGDSHVDSPTTPSDAIDATPVPCMPEAFTAPQAGCGTWATGNNVGIAMQQSGFLYLEVGSGSASTSSSCATLPRRVTSVTFDVQSVYASGFGQTTFLGLDASSTLWGVTFDYTGVAAQQLTWECQSTSFNGSWDMTSQRFIRVVDSNGTVSVQAGPSATNLTTMATCSDLGQFDAITVRTTASRAGGGASGSAALDSLEICQ